MGMDGGPLQAALMMTSSESERQRLLFISDNGVLVFGGESWENKEQPQAKYCLNFLYLLSQRAL